MERKRCVYRFNQLNVDILSVGSLKLDISDICGVSLTKVGSMMHFGKWRRIWAEVTTERFVSWSLLLCFSLTIFYPWHKIPMLYRFWPGLGVKHQYLVITNWNMLAALYFDKNLKLTRCNVNVNSLFDRKLERFDQISFRWSSFFKADALRSFAYSPNCSNKHCFGICAKTQVLYCRQYWNI